MSERKPRSSESLRRRTSKALAGIALYCGLAPSPASAQENAAMKNSLQYRSQVAEILKTPSISPLPTDREVLFQGIERPIIGTGFTLLDDTDVTINNSITKRGKRTHYRTEVGIGYLNPMVESEIGQEKLEFPLRWFSTTSLSAKIVSCKESLTKKCDRITITTQSTPDTSAAHLAHFRLRQTFVRPHHSLLGHTVSIKDMRDHDSLRYSASLSYTLQNGPDDDNGMSVRFLDKRK